MMPPPPPSVPAAAAVIPKAGSGVNIAEELKGATKVVLLKVRNLKKNDVYSLNTFRIWLVRVKSMIYSTVKMITRNFSINLISE